MSIKAIPPWYLLREIPFSAYIKALKPIYDVLEHKHKSKGDDDIFLKSILSSHAGMAQAAWDAAEQQRRYEKALQMKLGDFHEELMGSFPGYVNLPLGHETGCDVMKTDGTEVWEIKNRDNTMNSGSAKTVIDKLIVQKNLGRRAVLVLINCEKKTPPRFGAPTSIEVLTGQQAYAQLSGREDFFSDLNKTLAATFSACKEYTQLVALQ
jgi:hypothetical protein